MDELLAVITGRPGGEPVGRLSGDSAGRTVARRT